MPKCSVLKHLNLHSLPDDLMHFCGFKCLFLIFRLQIYICSFNLCLEIQVDFSHYISISPLVDPIDLSNVTNSKQTLNFPVKLLFPYLPSLHISASGNSIPQAVQGKSFCVNVDFSLSLIPYVLSIIKTLCTLLLRYIQEPTTS